MRPPKLSPCPRCARHVRRGPAGAADVCPFCGAVLAPAAESTARTRRARLSRAAIVAIGTAGGVLPAVNCGGQADVGAAGSHADAGEGGPPDGAGATADAADATFEPVLDAANDEAAADDAATFDELRIIPPYGRAPVQEPGDKDPPDGGVARPSNLVYTSSRGAARSEHA